MFCFHCVLFNFNVNISTLQQLSQTLDVLLLSFITDFLTLFHIDHMVTLHVTSAALREHHLLMLIARPSSNVFYSIPSALYPSYFITMSHFQDVL